MKSVATIGFFDGVHRGHQFVLQQVVQEAKNIGAQPLAITFIQHPRSILQTDYVPQLLTLPAERKELLLRQGVEVLELDFESIHHFTARQFMAYLRDTYQVCTLFLGYDHHFGSDDLYNFSDYQVIGEGLCMDVKQLPQLSDCYHISSSEIRTLLRYGQIDRVNDLLGHPYRLAGLVIHGNGIGRTIGFPTANIQIDTQKLLPADGVYIAFCSSEKCHKTPALVNIGTNPTIGNQARSIEAYLLKGQGDLYGKNLVFELLDFLREERFFQSIEELQIQIQKDNQHALNYFHAIK